MSELVGIIAPLKKFMSNSKEEVSIMVEGQKRVALSLEEKREYIIPDFQREIRWSNDNVAILVEDIKAGSKFIGNIILTKHSEKCYSIIDGQQRITILTMILNCIKHLHHGEIEIIEPCQLTIESFLGFSTLIEKSFSAEAFTEDLIESDKLKQRNKYLNLWKYIYELDEIKNKHKAKRFVENLGGCSFNVIINESGDISKGIRYFIDVNLKGKQLDVEDIFKSFLFKNDLRIDIRNEWYKLKTSVAKIDNSKMNYSILSLLEHYFLCDIYSYYNFKGMEFGSDFLLKKAYKDKDGIEHREGTHLIELINSNSYMLKSLKQLNSIVDLMLEIVNSHSLTTKVIDAFSVRNKRLVDDVELKVIHNIIGKILKDSRVLPKALILKYFLILLHGEEERTKESVRDIYGVYLFTVLFYVFENKKSSEVLTNIIKAKDVDWYKELVNQIKGYFSLDRITDSKLLAQYRFSQNEDEEDQKFRCKSLATIYNFFINSNDRVRIRGGKINELYEYVINDNAFSVEHLIISDSKDRGEKNIIIENNKKYTVDETIYKRYVNNFFNFIFISKQLNSNMGNHWLPKKLELLHKEDIKCEYSKMIIENLNELSHEFEKRGGENYIDNLDLFFVREFKEVYLNYAKKTLEQIIEHIKNY